jgi:hypothetical protein
MHLNTQKYNTATSAGATAPTFSSTYFTNYFVDSGSYNPQKPVIAQTYTGLTGNRIILTNKPDSRYTPIVFKNNAMLYSNQDYTYRDGTFSFGIALQSSDTICITYQE